MSANWITDRMPTKSDAGYCEHVWITTFEGTVLRIWYASVDKGTPWMPIEQPEPYVKPKRFRVTHSLEGEPIVMECETNTIWATAPTRDAAERIAAIYEEAMP